jgi:hypothetical protein
MAIRAISRNSPEQAKRVEVARNGSPPGALTPAPQNALLDIAPGEGAMKVEELEQRLRVLEDVEEIKRLKAQYAALCDNNYDCDGIAALFTSDGIWDGSDLGRTEGRDAIRAFFVKAPKAFPFAIHNVMNPIIEVSGDTARGP